MTKHTTGPGDGHRADQRDRGHHNRGGTGHGQRDHATHDTNRTADGDGQSRDLVAHPEGLVIPQRGWRTYATEPVARQSFEEPEHPDDGDDQPNHQRHERDEMHDADGKW